MAGRSWSTNDFTATDEFRFALASCGLISSRESVEDMAKRTYLEFFAGGGMARAGLGKSWRCLFANDFDRMKVETYEANWGAETSSIRMLRPYSLGPSCPCGRSRMGVFPMSGPVPRRKLSWTGSGARQGHDPIRHILALLEADPGLGARGTRSARNRS